MPEESPALVTLTHPSFAFEENPCLVLVPKDDTPRACLEELVRASEDLPGLFSAHADIDEEEPWFGWAFQLSARTLVEAELFPRSAAEEELRPLLETYANRVIDYFRQTGGEPGFYVNEEMEAGSKAIESLVIADPATYLPLYIRFLKVIDLEHTVEQHSVVRRIVVRLSEEQRALLKETIAGLSGGESFSSF